MMQSNHYVKKTMKHVSEGAHGQFGFDASCHARHDSQRNAAAVYTADVMNICSLHNTIKVLHQPMHRAGPYHVNMWSQWQYVEGKH